MSLLNKLSSDSTLSKKTCENLFVRIFEVIRDLITNREVVIIDNFGLFKVQRRKVQTMIDYNRKVVVLLPPKDKIIFEFRNGSTSEEIPASLTPVFSSKKIVNLVSEKSGIDEITVYEFFSILFEVIREYLDEKRNINIIEFGKFRVSRKDKISFSPAKKFADKVNYNFNNLNAQIIRSLNKDEIKKLYKERLSSAEKEELLSEETDEAQEILTAGDIAESKIQVEEPVRKEFISPQIKKESPVDIPDLIDDKIILKTEKPEEDIELEEKIASDFKIIEEIFKEKETQDKSDDFDKEADIDILLIPDTDEQISIEERIAGQEETFPPVIPTPPQEPEEHIPAPPQEPEEHIPAPPVEHPYYTPVKDSPVTEKIVSDFEEKIKSYLKRAEEERESFVKEIDKEKPTEKRVTLPGVTIIPEPPVEEIEKAIEQEQSFIKTLDRIIKDDEEEIEPVVIKTDDEIIIPESFADITDKGISEDVIETAGIPEEKIISIPSEPSTVQIVEEKISEEDEDNIPISEVYRRLKEGFMNEDKETDEEKTESKEPVTAKEPMKTITPEFKEPSVIIQKTEETIPLKTEENKIKVPVFQDIKVPELPELKLPEPELPELKLPEPELPELKLPEPELPELKLPEPELPELKLPEPELPEPELPEPELPELKLPKPKFSFPETTIPAKEDIRYSEESSYEAKKKDFEKLMQKFSEDFKPEEFKTKDEEDIKISDIKLTPPVSKPSEGPAETPFKPLNDDDLQTESEDTLNDLKSYIDKINKEKSTEPDKKPAGEDTLPFRKVGDIDLPKSIDDYFEEIKKDLEKRKSEDKDK